MQLALEATFCLTGDGGYVRPNRDACWLDAEKASQAIAKEPQLCALAWLHNRTILVVEDGGALGATIMAYYGRLPAPPLPRSPCRRLEPAQAMCDDGCEYMKMTAVST